MARWVKVTGVIDIDDALIEETSEGYLRLTEQADRTLRSAYPSLDDLEFEVQDTVERVKPGPLKKKRAI